MVNEVLLYDHLEGPLANLLLLACGGLLHEATEDRATITAGAYVRASAQWLTHERYAGSRPHGSHQLGKTPIRPLLAFAFQAPPPNAREVRAT